MTSVGSEAEIGDVYLVFDGWIGKASRVIGSAKLPLFGSCAETEPAHVDLAKGLKYCGVERLEPRVALVIATQFVHRINLLRGLRS